MGCKLCTHQCECVGTKIPPSQKSRYLGTCVLITYYDDIYNIRKIESY